ncbi:MAG: PadR family transcriptional regulator [Deltaproteobacteria bacterium]|nr:PadR family transcriptional regulator [Deltaproteobacteria bacterium]
MSLKYSILGLLQYRDMHGYQIKKTIENQFGHMWTINYGQIYPNLKKLKDEGLVTMIEDANHGEKGPSRKMYSITGKGNQVFLEWLESLPEKNMILRDPFLMRFVFFGFGDKKRSIEIVDDQINLYKAQMKKRRENLERLQHHDIYVRLMAELGVSMNELLLEWLERSRKEIGKSMKDPTASSSRRLWRENGV